MKAVNIPAKFVLPFAANAGASFKNAIPPSTSTPGAASLDQGFPPDTAQPVGSGGIPPSIKDFNGILNETSAWNQWQQAGGPIVYDGTFQTAIGGYPKGAMVISAFFPGKSWLSLADDNLTNPDTGGVGWQNLNLPTFANFKSGAGNYTPPAGCTRIRIRMCGSGGGGGGGTHDNPNVAGSDGNLTSFGAWTALGGKGGSASNSGNNPAPGGVGGANGTGTLIQRIAGGYGATPWTCQGGTGLNNFQLNGGVNPFGGNGGQVSPNTGAGGPSILQFLPSNQTSAGPGGAGEFVEFMMTIPNSPSPIAYVVGAKPTAAPNAPNSSDGVIYIEEYYN